MGDADTTWVTLAEAMAVDGLEAWSEALSLMRLAATLADEGIAYAFDPYPPGEGFAYPPMPVPFRLLVRQEDLERARAIASDLLGEEGS
ncbi:MAG: hypothetical protein IBX62_00850 [Coriobacteriia bacterium]|nr:hypothetical protein [Coriobacteriia bacterium]